jgi:heparosan-N-sulfate-glucuronate 5-epimerase
MTIKKKQLRDDLLSVTFRGSKKEVANYTKCNTLRLDENGVLMYKIPYTNNWNYYPIFIARYSLGNFEFYIDTNDKKYLDVFFNQVNWLLNNLKYKKKFAVWEHNYKLPFYETFKIPWIHGLGQALGMVSLLKAYQITKEAKYLETSEKVMNSFDIKIEEDGVKYVDENDETWYEEYALLPPPHVLNGFITILFGLHEFNRVTGSKKAQQLYNDGLKTVRNNIVRYDLGYWSIYDLQSNYPTTKAYHNLHLLQLNILHEITNDKIYKEYAKRWEDYKNNKFNTRKAYVTRGFIHLKRYGIINSIMRYYNRKKWNMK